MRLSIGYYFQYQLQQITPMIALLNVHHSRVHDLEGDDRLQTVPELAQTRYVDGFGNICTRWTAPVGKFVLQSDGVIFDDGLQRNARRSAAASSCPRASPRPATVRSAACGIPSTAERSACIVASK